MLVSKTTCMSALVLVTIPFTYYAMEEVEQTHMPQSIQEMKYDENKPEFQAALPLHVGLSRIGQAMYVGGRYGAYAFGGLVCLTVHAIKNGEVAKIYWISRFGLMQMGIKTDSDPIDVAKKTVGVAIVSTVGSGLAAGALYGAYRAYSYKRAHRRNKGKNVLGACAQNDVNGVQAWLADNPTVVMSTDERGRTPLMYAAANNACDAVDVILERAPKIIDFQDGVDKRTALVIAGYCGHSEILKKLLAKKANASLRDRFDNEGISEQNRRALKSALRDQLKEEHSANRKVQ